jgi:hypothetical protein
MSIKYTYQLYLITCYAVFMMTMRKTVAQQAQHQKAQLIARLQALDPTRSVWSLSDSYRELMQTILYLSDRKVAC